MWFRVKEWLQSPAPVSVVNACDIREDLTAPMIMYDQLGRLGLEPKAELKKDFAFDGRRRCGGADICRTGAS